MSSYVWIAVGAGLALVILVWVVEVWRDRRDRRDFDDIVRDIQKAKRRRPTNRVPWGAAKNKPGRKQRGRDRGR